MGKTGKGTVIARETLGGASKEAAVVIFKEADVVIFEVEFKRVEGVDSDGTARVIVKVTPEIDISLAELRLNNETKDTLENIQAGRLIFSFNQNDLKVGDNVMAVRVQLKDSDITREGI